LLTGKRENLNRGLLLRIKIGWFAANDVNMLQTPAYSPDTNPIENLWHFVKLKLKGRRFKTKDELWSKVGSNEGLA
jgi:transposase